jgi:hypothetical protein
MTLIQRKGHIPTTKDMARPLAAAKRRNVKKSQRPNSGRDAGSEQSEENSSGREETDG